jgi:hypothetical protein
MRCDTRGFATLGLSALLISTSASTVRAADAPAAADHELAVWVPLQLIFRYTPLTTTYSCSGLEQRVKALLIKLGARADLEARGYGCTQLTGPDPLAGVRIKMNVLEPAGAHPGLAAHWRRVNLLEDRDLLSAAADCELIEQIAQKIVPLFTVRNVDYHAACPPQSPSPESVRLQADVLVADQSPPAASPAP